jgi:TPR repeat protein
MIIPTSRQTAVGNNRASTIGQEPRSKSGRQRTKNGKNKKDRKMFQGHFNQDTAMPVETGANGDVLFDLGMLYASGRSGLFDLVAAHKWFNLAALKGRVDAIALRREIAEMMSDVEIAMAQREARAWMTTH